MAPSSAAAAVKEALIVTAMCVVLLHSSMGYQQPPPPPHTPGSHHHHHHHHHHHRHPPPVPAPAPAPVNCGSCFSRCPSTCGAIQAKGQAKCKSDVVANHKSCYLSCTSRVFVCHGKQTCLHSGCLVGQCDTCSSNHNATSCCQLCASAVDPGYKSCLLNYDLAALLGCINNCQDSCRKNCTLGA